MYVGYMAYMECLGNGGCMSTNSLHCSSVSKGNETTGGLLNASAARGCTHS